MRRCPAVDPDDHRVFVSPGCAAEDLAHVALAHGLQAEARFDPLRGGIQVALAPTRAQASPLYQAFNSRQCTRGDYDGKPLSTEELKLLERAGTSSGVRLLLLTGLPVGCPHLEAAGREHSRGRQLHPRHGHCADVQAPAVTCRSRDRRDSLPMRRCGMLRPASH